MRVFLGPPENAALSDAFAHNHGGLHRALGIPEGTDIPIERLRKAAHSDDEHVRKMAQAALNMRNARS